jgi:hypothetical protein
MEPGEKGVHSPGLSESSLGSLADSINESSPSQKLGTDFLTDVSPSKGDEQVKFVDKEERHSVTFGQEVRVCIFGLAESPIAIFHSLQLLD